jgi:hypothetical protein
MIRQGRPEYDATVGAMACFQREFNGRQPAILPSPRLLSSILPASTNRRCACCSAAMLCVSSSRPIWQGWKPTGNGAS